MKNEFLLVPFYNNSFWDRFSCKVNMTRDESLKSLLLEYMIEGPINEIILPRESSASGFKEELWKETCFEFFYGIDQNSPEYTEWNFSTNKNFWMAKFINYRERNENQDNRKILPPDILIKKSVEKLNFIVTIPFNSKKPLADFQLAIITKENKSENFWAINHAKQKPDFHNRNSWNKTF